jgi:protein Mpv17
MMINSTIQAALLTGLSNLLAQIIQAYRAGRPLSLEHGPLAQFVVFSLISTPPNVLWQKYLEERFPANQRDEKGNKKLHKGNTVAKLVLHQTLGAIFNSYLFIAGIGALRGKDLATILIDCQRVC